MKLLTDYKYKTNTIVLEGYKPQVDTAMTAYNFCQDAFSVPEVIAGIFFHDCSGNTHYLELNNQPAATLLFTLKAIALRLPLHIVYDDMVVVHNVPGWLTWILSALGFMPPQIKYSDLLKHAQPHPSNTVSQSVYKQT